MNNKVKKHADANRILVIMSESPQRANISNTLSKAEFEVIFCTSTAEAYLLLPKIRPQVLLHNWGNIDESQAASFHQRIMRNEEYAKICRVLIVDEISAKFLALSLDCGIRRVMTSVSAQVNLVQEIRMALVAEDSLSELQKKVREMRMSPQNYDQKLIDNSVEDAYQRFSHDPTVKVEYGNLCVRKEDFPKAEKLANDLLRKEPQNVRAMNLLSRCMLKTGRLEEGIKVLEGANKLSPKNSERLAQLGSACLQKGDKKAAKEYLVESIKVDPKNKEAAADLGVLVVESDNVGEFANLFENSLSEEEKVGFFNNAAVFQVRNKSLPKALKLYDMALEAAITPKVKSAVQFNLGLAYRRLGKYEESLSAFSLCLTINPEHEKAKKQKAEVEEEIKRRKGAFSSNESTKTNFENIENTIFTDETPGKKD